MKVQEKMRGKVEEAAGEIRRVMCHEAMEDGKGREREKEEWKGNYRNEGDHVVSDGDETEYRQLAGGGCTQVERNVEVREVGLSATLLIYCINMH